MYLKIIIQIDNRCISSLVKNEKSIFTILVLIIKILK